jgi:Domain of unknown function (DUF4412)
LVNAAAVAALVLAGGGGTGAARTQVYFEQTTVSRTEGGAETVGLRSRVWYAGRHMRLEAGEAAGGPALIVRLDEARAYRLDPETRTAMPLDVDRLRAQSQQDAAVAGDLMGAGEEGSARTERLPGSKMIAGHACEGYRIRAHSAVLEVYTTRSIPVGMEAFAELLEWSGASQALAGLVAELKRLPGFPLETRSRVEVLGEVHETVSTVTKVVVGPLGPELFEPPPDYRIVEPQEPEP